MNLFKHFYACTHGVRRDGAAALDLCYVAAGRIDGFWESDLNPWDVAAGILMVEEAGGKTTDFRGQSSAIHDRQILATNGHIHEAMMEALS
jgi:myo-inositol-1(or 4)-monophosphatase